MRTMAEELCYVAVVGRVMTVSLVFCETPKSGSGYVSDSFDCSCDSFPPIELPCPALNMKALALSYCILFCHSWLMSLADLPFSEGN